MGGEENVKVVCRVRSLNKKEIAKGETNVVEVVNNQQVKLIGKDKKYNFDAVIPPDATQFEVYSAAAKKLVGDILRGYNGTIFAYGQTAAGKTFTMEGDMEDDEMRGIIPRIIEDIFEISKHKLSVELSVNVSYFEIYNEKIRDLLDKNKINLPIHEDKYHSPYIKNLTEVQTEAAAEIDKLIAKGKKNRAVTGTGMNDQSSRSHAVFQMLVSQNDKENHKKTTGRLFLVDLAGSEKVNKTGATGETLTEAKNINRSLSCLGIVIAALTENNRAHVPYRDSKLTRILQQSLGGNARTTIVICVSPAASNESETVSTLLFGVRAKTIKNLVSANVEVSAAEWRNRFNKVTTHLAKIKDLALKLCKEAKKWRDGKEPSKNEKIDIDKLMQLLEQGVDFDETVEKEAKEERVEEGDPNEMIDEARLRQKLSLVVHKPKDKGDKDKDKEKKVKVDDDEEPADEKVIEKVDKEVVDEAEEKSSSSIDIPEDVLAVLRAEIDLKTKQLKEEKTKLTKLVDDREDEIAQLEVEKYKLEEKAKISERLLKDARHELKKSAGALKAAQEEISMYKERNRILESDAMEAQTEAQKTKEQSSAVLHAKNEASTEAKRTKTEMETQKQKVSDQLIRFAADVTEIGQIVCNDLEDTEKIDVEVKKESVDETLIALRVSLTKIKHYVRRNREAFKGQYPKANEKQTIEQMIVINQTKERIGELEDDVDKANNRVRELEEKIDNKNAKIAQIIKGKGVNDNGCIDPDLDPDLQMLLDGHLKQLRKLRVDIDELKKRVDELTVEKEQWQVIAETSKAEVQKAVSLLSAEEDDDEDDFSGTLMSKPGDPIFDDVQSLQAPGQASEFEVQTLHQIKKDMDGALAMHRSSNSPDGMAEAEKNIEVKEDEKEEDFKEMNQKQIAHLEVTLQSVATHNRALSAENRILKVQRLPALQATVKSLQEKIKELEELLEDARRNC